MTHPMTSPPKEISQHKIQEFLLIYKTSEELLLKTRLAEDRFRGRRDIRGFEVLKQRINQTIHEEGIRLIYKKGGSPYEFKGVIWTPTSGRCLYLPEMGSLLIAKSFDGKIHYLPDKLNLSEGSIVCFDSGTPINSKRLAINVVELFPTYRYL
jgi:hypothetical protein